MILPNAKPNGKTETNNPPVLECLEIMLTEMEKQMLPNIIVLELMPGGGTERTNKKRV